MAPELFLSDFRLDGRIDSWSLGIVLHKMLLGHVPFDSKYEERLQNRICTRHIDFSTDIWEQLSIDVQDLIENLLQKDPANRLTIAEIISHSWVMNMTVDDRIQTLQSSNKSTIENRISESI